MRTCRKCGQEHALSSFPVNLTLGNGSVLYKHTCSACRKAQTRDRVRLHRQHERPTSVAPCPICVRPTSSWVLDHDHATGRFRGWLCNDCNNGLGKFEDDPTVLERAVRYLVGAGGAAGSAE